MGRATSAAVLLAAVLSAAPAPAGGAGAGWRLVWEDEFDGPALNASNWNVVESGEGGNQIELYTADNVFLTTTADGRSALALRTRPQDVEWVAAGGCVLRGGAQPCGLAVTNRQRRGRAGPDERPA
jgi:hypothetical protein